MRFLGRKKELHALRAIRRYFVGFREGTHPRRIKIDLPKVFPEFAPASAGHYLLKSHFTISSIKNTFVSFGMLLDATGFALKVVQSKYFWTTLETPQRDFVTIADAFNRHGSDKSNGHSYENIYGPILSDLVESPSLLEIGMGTNNTKVLSNMSKWGKPGASLRAFRDLLPNSKIFGADIDSNILFSEDLIQTFYVDQTNFSTLLALEEKLGSTLDLIIDDGLHSPEANLNVVRFAERNLNLGGWLVIEDINAHALNIFRVLSYIMKESWLSFIIEDHENLVFVAKRIR